MRFWRTLTRSPTCSLIIPRRAHKRAELGPGIWYYPSGSYLVFYSISDHFIEIRRIMHGAREITASLFDD